MLWYGSSSSISFATVTPSLVTVGEPHFLSSTTLRPRGPRVTLTAFAKISTPSRMACRACSLKSNCLAAIDASYQESSDGRESAMRGPGRGIRLLVRREHAEHVVF